MFARRALLFMPMAALASGADIAPGGRLRLGIGVGEVGSAFWTVRDAAGAPRGVTVDLGRAMAASLSLPLDITPYNASGEVTEAVARGDVDVAFMPTDPQRAARVAFGPDFFLFTSTLLVMPGVAGRTVEDVAVAPLRIVGVRNTTTIRAAERTFTRASFTAAVGMADALAALREGRADAVALGLESLVALLPQLPGARILEGHFHASGTAIAVPPGRPAALAAATAWMEAARADGTVRRALDAHGITGPVAPPGSRTGTPV
jgi:polar amino acid transport system substrate-binding protein